MRGGERRRRVAETVRREVAGILRFQFSDPRLARATVTRAEVSGDLSVARVHVSVLGTGAEQKETLEVLERVRGRVRSLLGRRVRLRQTPEVRFVFDSSVEFSIRLERLIERERERAPVEEESSGTGSSTPSGSGANGGGSGGRS